MDFLQAIILSIVEGISEFLPISSTGHLVLTSDLLNIPQTNFVKSFEIIIQLGAILAVVFIYWKKLIENIKLWKIILIAFLPTAVIGFLLYSVVKNFLLGNSLITIGAIFLGGILLIILEMFYKEMDHHIGEFEKINYKQAFLIGLIQSVSIIPGVSRAAASIIGGLFVGLKRKVAVEFSFLLAIPTMLGATSLDLIKSNFNFSMNEIFLLATGLTTSFIVALIVVKWFLKYIQNHNFIIFGIYRIILAVLFWFFVLK